MGENLTIRNKHVRTALKLMEDAMIFWTWQWILQEVQKIQDIHSKHQICRGKPLPPDYERSIGCLEALLFDLCRRRAKLTYQLLPTHAGFSNHWNVEYMQRLQTMIMYPQKKSDLDTSEFFFKDRLHFCLAAICEMLAPPPELFHSDIEYWFHEPSDLYVYFLCFQCTTKQWKQQCGEIRSFQCNIALLLITTPIQPYVSSD